MKTEARQALDAVFTNPAASEDEKLVLFLDVAEYHGLTVQEIKDYLFEGDEDVHRRPES